MCNTIQSEGKQILPTAAVLSVSCLTYGTNVLLSPAIICAKVNNVFSVDKLYIKMNLKESFRNILQHDLYIGFNKFIIYSIVLQIKSTFDYYCEFIMLV